MAYSHEEKLLSLIKKEFGKYTYVFSNDQYSSWDVMVLEKNGKIRCFLELKTRSSDKCKYVRRDDSLLVDQYKVNALSELSKEKAVPCYMVQYLEDRNELTIVQISDEKGKINPKFKNKTIQANQNTFWGGGKVNKGMCFVNLQDCWRKVLK